jgi:hypothetical protein
LQNIEGSTLFIQRQGKALQEFVFSDSVQAYTSAKISLLSSHLLKSPEEMAVRVSTSTDEGDRLLIVNGDDGSIACYTLLRSQNVIAPSEWTTDGEFIRPEDCDYVFPLGDEKLMVNVGSVGQPRDEDARSCYGNHHDAQEGDGYQVFRKPGGSFDVDRSFHQLPAPPSRLARLWYNLPNAR